MPGDEERPIALTSRTLSKAEQNYAQIEREALGIIFGVRRFHSYLYGRHFVLLTDHRPLTTILSNSKAIPSMVAARLQRWALILAAHNYTIKYRRAADHGNADGLSRLPLPVQHTEKPGTIDTFLVQRRLDAFLLQYRNAPHSTTQEAPAMLFLHRKLRTRLDLLKPSVAAVVDQAQDAQRSYRAMHSKSRSFRGRRSSRGPGLPEG